MKIFLIVLFVNTMFIVSCSNTKDEVIEQNKNEESFPPQLNEKTPAEMKQDLINYEKNNPLEFVGLGEAYLEEKNIKVRDGNFFRRSEYKPDGYDIFINIYSKSTLASYKDFEIELSYVSQTNSTIKQETLMVYEFLYPDSSIDPSVHIYPPKEFSTINYKLLNALPD